MAASLGVLVGIWVCAYGEPRSWMPTSVRRAHNYASALKTLAWGERATSEWIEKLTGITILTASAAVVVVFSIHLVPFAPRTIRRSLTQRFQKPLNPFKEGYDKDN